MADPTPGIAGQSNDLCTSNGQAGATVRFAYSFVLGSTSTPCGIVALESPLLAGSAVADQNGDACLTGAVPNGAGGRTLFFQAIEVDTCERSNVSCFTFE